MTVGWLPGSPCARRPLRLFEVELATHVLQERPRPTSLDWLVLDERVAIAAEAKFTERGFGRCSCDGRDVGDCSVRVLERPYWKVASRDLSLRRNNPPASCSLNAAAHLVTPTQRVRLAKCYGPEIVVPAAGPYFELAVLLVDKPTTGKGDSMLSDAQELASALADAAQLRGFIRAVHFLVPDDLDATPLIFHHL